MVYVAAELYRLDAPEERFAMGMWWHLGLGAVGPTLAQSHHGEAA